MGEEETGLPLDSDSRDGLLLVDQGKADLEDETELLPSLSFSILLYDSGTTPGHKECIFNMHA